MPSIPQPLVPGDDGGADPSVAAALAAFASGTGGAAEVASALSTARLLVPVVALLTESELGENGLRREKESEMALPVLVGADGRKAVPAFTGAESLRLWRADARPIQALTPQVCRAALGEDAAAVMIDVAGPVPFAIEGGVLRALASIGETSADRDGVQALLRGLAPHADVTVARVAPAKRGLFRRLRGDRG
ncbi:SseB family protein [Sphaerisporangium album]|uniref:SseB family protein n=1 Tax=Sphaerisporangium album TaxID=509200 RepID=A0A367FI92_9ACTN|nr:SseB family protein [Sphaerisporangium album]RCG29355.1 SseB family protein [Sphaerisporangium album]